MLPSFDLDWYINKRLQLPTSRPNAAKQRAVKKAKRKAATKQRRQMRKK